MQTVDCLSVSVEDVKSHCGQVCFNKRRYYEINTKSRNGDLPASNVLRPEQYEVHSVPIVSLLSAFGQRSYVSPHCSNLRCCSSKELCIRSCQPGKLFLSPDSSSIPCGKNLATPWIRVVGAYFGLWPSECIYCVPRLRQRLASTTSFDISLGQERREKEEKKGYVRFPGKVSRLCLELEGIMPVQGRGRSCLAFSPSQSR